MKPAKPLQLAPHDRVVIVGVTGSGKSTYARDTVWTPAKKAVAWDPYGEFPGDRLTVDEFIEDAGRLMGTKAYHYSIRPAGSMPGEVAEDFKSLVDVLQEFGGYVFVVDECALLRARAGDAIEMVATQSRHWGHDSGEPGVPTVFLSQRSVGIPLTAREQASVIVSFAQTTPEDLRVLAAKCGEEFAARVGICTRAKHDHAIWREDD
jgi:hypothetical protein